MCRVRSCPQCNLIMEELRRRCANGYLQRWNAARGFSSTAPLDTRAMPHKIPRHDAEFPATRCRSKRETQSKGRQNRWRRLIVSLRQPATSTPTYWTGITPSNPPPIDSGKLFFGRPLAKAPARRISARRFNAAELIVACLCAGRKRRSVCAPRPKSLAGHFVHRRREPRA